MGPSILEVLPFFLDQSIKATYDNIYYVLIRPASNEISHIQTVADGLVVRDATDSFGKETGYG